MRTCLAALATVLLATLSTSALAQEELLDGIAAQVGSDIVLISEVRDSAAPMEQRLDQMGGTEQDYAALRADVLERLIERALVKQVVRKAELQASEVEIDNAVQAIASDNGISMDELVASVQAQGLPFEVYRQRIKGEIEQSKVINGMVASKIHIEESEMRDRYDEVFAEQPSGGTEVHLLHLLAAVKDEAAPARRAACVEAESARARIQSGERFQLVAAEYLDADRPSPIDLGFIHEAVLASWMAVPVAKLDPGQMTPVLEMPFGCNVLLLVERRDFTPRSYEDTKEQIHQQMFSEKMQAEYVRFMERLRRQTYIERKGLFADAARLGGLEEQATPQQDGF